VSEEKAMAMRDLIPWTRSRDIMTDFWRDERTNPFFTLHREMNRFMDEVLRTFASRQITISAEMPGIDEKGVELLLRDGNLIIRGELKCETEEKERQWSERFYGRFERQIPVGFDIDEEKIEAAFKNGILTITCPKSERAQEKAKRIAINAPTKH
jgi:HSP20 family protein